MDIKEIVKELKWVMEQPKSRIICDSHKEEIYSSSIAALEKQMPKKGIKLEKVSQACPVCERGVNWRYCSNCGQKLEY